MTCLNVVLDYKCIALIDIYCVSIFTHYCESHICIKNVVLILYKSFALIIEIWVRVFSIYFHHLSKSNVYVFWKELKMHHLNG